MPNKLTKAMITSEKTQFVITGVLGRHSNAYGPNEFLHIAMGRGVTLAVSQVLVDHFARGR